MAKEKKDKHFLKQPIYEGGPKAIQAFLAQHMKYPAEALTHGIEGTVFIKYTIDQHGEVADAKVIAALGHGCDEEALRVVRMLKFKVPKNRGLRVLFHKNIQVHFRLPQAKPAEEQTVQYTYTPSPSVSSPAKEEAQKPQGGYSYTFDLG